MWNVAVSYDDPGNFMADKALFAGAIQSVIGYLNQFIVGNTTLNVAVSVSATSTGRFAGNGAVTLDYTADGLNYLVAQAAKELAVGGNLNGSEADLTIYVDPGSSYFQGLNFTTAAYDSARTVPSDKTDGMSVLLHELMHGLGINSYRDHRTLEFISKNRMLWDKYVYQQNGKLYFDSPSLAAHGIDALDVTSTSATQNVSHIGDASNLQQGYLDDIMNGLYFYLGHQYPISQLDLLILQDLGYTVTIPDGLALSDSSLTGKGLIVPSVAADAARAALTGNVLHLSGTAAAGATTSVLEHNTLLAQTKADANGNWVLDVVIDPSRASSALVVRDGSHVVDSAPVAVVRSGDTGLQLSSSKLYTHLLGGAHDDVLTAAVRGLSMDGGAGLDRVVYAETRAANTIVRQADGSFRVAHGAASDTLTGIERVQFSDTMVALDIGVDGTAGQAYRIYQAAFNRTPDTDGLGFWINVMDHGATLAQVTQSFVASAEFRNLYGAQPSNAEILTRYYQNVLHRAADQAGFDYWLDVMDHHGGSAAAVLADFGQSEENVAALVGVLQNGVSYTPYG